MPSLYRHATLVGYKAGSDIAGKAAVFAVLLLAARRLSTEAFGILSLATTLGWLLSVGADFGLQLYLAREIARAPDRAAAILQPLLRLRVALALVAIALVVPFAFAWLPHGVALPFVVIVAAAVVSALVEFLNHVYRGLSRSELESSLNLGQRLVTLAAAVVLLVVWPSLSALSVAMVVPPLAAFVLSRRLIARMTAIQAADQSPVRATTTGLSRATFLRDIAPIGAGIVLSALYFRVDLFLLEYWKGVEAVARYNAVFRLVDALRLFPAALLVVLLPAVFGRRDMRFLVRLSAGLFAFGAVVTAVLYPVAPRFLALAYGPDYLQAAPAFQVLLLAFPLLSLNYGLTMQVIGWDGQRAYAVLCGLALAVNVGMNVVLIPRAGAMGAAWATVGTEVFLTIACVVVLARIRRA